MARPALARASSSTSDESTSTQSCIVVKPTLASSPRSDGSHGASSTPPTSVNPTPSITSDQFQASPKRSASAMSDEGVQFTRSTRRKKPKVNASNASCASTDTPISAQATAKRRVSAKAKKVEHGMTVTREHAVKGTKYLSLESWLSQSQSIQPPVHEASRHGTGSAQALPGPRNGSKRKRQSELPTSKPVGPRSERRRATALSQQTTAATKQTAMNVEIEIKSSLQTAPGEAASDGKEDREELEPSSKRAKLAKSARSQQQQDNSQDSNSSIAAKAGATAARAKSMITAARRSGREVAAKIMPTATTKTKKPLPSSGDASRSRSVRKSTRDVNAAPSNEEKAATALKQDSKKMQNKKMLTKGKFSTGPVDEAMPLPNNWYIGKFGGTNDTYLKEFTTARGFKLGAEIFNPQPSSFVREGKDWSVTKGAKNVFAGNARATWAKTDFANLPVSFCNCKAADACGVDCWNRTMEYECNDNNCAVGAALCKNRPFASLMKRLEKAESVNNRQKEQERLRSEAEKRRPKYASVAMSFDQGVEVLETAGKGYGVRAQRSFEPYQIIMEYFGEIIDQDEVENRMATVYKNSTDFYMMQFHDGFILDATKGSMARFVNHSCEPNCHIRKMLVPTTVGKKTSVEPRMALFAGKNGIQFNEELTYDYNFDPFSTRNVQECLCGSAKCRGFLGPRAPKERGVGVSAGNAKERATAKSRTEITKISTVTKVKSGVVTTNSILRAAKRARF